MTDHPPERQRPASPPTPGERRLAHPPSDRYRVEEPLPAGSERAGSPLRAMAFGLAATVAGAVAITVLGGVLAISAGLLVVAVATGWAVAMGLRFGAGSPPRPSRIVGLAVALALLGVVLGQAGLWAYARTEGGVLGPVDYLGETFGPLVAIQLVAAAISAWLTAR